MRDRRDFFEIDEEMFEPECFACEQMLTDALDETLTEPDQRWFSAHTAQCSRCGEMLANAKRGAAWLEVLKTSPPAPSTDLFERILMQTSGVDEHESSFASIAPLAKTVWRTPTRANAAPAGSNLLTFRPRASRLQGLRALFFDQRLMMTAAMAFFSVALTLNLTGVRLNELHASSVSPEHLRRSFFEARASAVRSYDSLRVVHVLESRVDDLREATDLDGTAGAAEPKLKRTPREEADPSSPSGASSPSGPASSPAQEKQPAPLERRGISESQRPAQALPSDLTGRTKLVAMPVDGQVRGRVLHG